MHSYIHVYAYMHACMHTYSITPLCFCPLKQLARDSELRAWLWPLWPPPSCGQGRCDHNQSAQLTARADCCSTNILTAAIMGTAETITTIVDVLLRVIMGTAAIMGTAESLIAIFDVVVIVAITSMAIVIAIIIITI